MSLAKGLLEDLWGHAVDRRHIELQIRLVVVMHRFEQRRHDAPTMEEFRDHARSILDGLEEEVRPYPDLETQLGEARQELDADL